MYIPMTQWCVLHTPTSFIVSVRTKVYYFNIILNKSNHVKRREESKLLYCWGEGVVIGYTPKCTVLCIKKQHFPLNSRILEGPVANCKLEYQAVTVVSIVLHCVVSVLIPHHVSHM